MLFLLQGHKMILKKVKEKLNKIKICAVFTATCFIISTLGANLYAIPIAENTTQKYEDVFNKASSISNEYGKITSSKDANSDITVINIQDLHCHPQTQRNISKIIGQIANKYNLKSIYVEGGYGNIDTSWLNQIKDENIRKQAIEKLLENGILTGSEYYKLTSNNESVELKGIDEEEIHKDNVKRLSWIISQQDKFKGIIEKVSNEIKILEKIYINKRNERFNDTIDDYLSNKIDSKKFYRQLIKYVKDINNYPDKYNNITTISLEDYPNITKFLSMVTDSHKINVKKVKIELQELISLLKNKLPFGVYSKLLKETNNFTDNQKSLELINLLCEKENIDLNKDFKEIVKLLHLNLNNNNFNPIELVLEERQLIMEIRKALSYNNEEYEITFVSDFNSYFKDYLEYKLTDADWKYFSNYYEQFKQLYSKYAIIDRIKDIDQDCVEINKYYTINDQRNDIFIENLLKNENINLINSNKQRSEEEILKNSKKVIIAVTGGFHSSELEELLSKKEVNTIIITPTIYESTQQANKKYINLIKEQSKINSQALAYTIASCIKDIEKQKLLLIIVKELIGDNQDKLQSLLDNNINLSLIENIEPLTQQEEKQLNQLKKYIETATEILIALLPKEGGKTIFVPNINKTILQISKKLIKSGIFFNNGPILEAEEQGLPDLQEIPAEIYSRMHTIIQEALLKSNISNTETKGDYTPQLTMTFLKKILDKTFLKRNTKIKIVAVIEAPIIMLGLIFPSVNNWFLKQHKVKDLEDKIIIRSELETLDDNIKNIYFDSFIKIKETIKIPFVRTIVAFSISTVKALKANIQGHIEFNTTAYLIQSYKDLADFDIKYAEIFKYTNLTTIQEKKIIRDVLNLKDKFNTNGSSKSYNSKELSTLLQQFEKLEILFFSSNKKPLYLNSIINTPEDLKKINSLLKELYSSNIFNIETEYNMLALKIFTSDIFNKLIEQSNMEYGNQSVSQKYFIAIAVARYIEQALNGNPINNQNFDETIRIATETYIEILKNNENRVVIDENTKIIAISAQSDKNQEFNNNGVKKLLQKLNIPVDGENRKFLSTDTESALKIKQDFLNLIANLNSNDKNVFISFDGHGLEEILILNSYLNVTITVDELFNALKKAQKNGFDLNNLTINLSSCESWFFANSLYDKFNNFYNKLETKNKLQSKSYPTIWAAAGHETKYGYTDEYYSLSTPLFNDQGEINDSFELRSLQVGNEWNGVLMTFQNGQKDLRIKDILRATLEAKKSNFTLFISDKNIEQICNESTKKILDLNSHTNINEEKQQNIKGFNTYINKFIDFLIKVNNFSILQFLGINNNNNIETSNFKRGYFELSIFTKLKNKNKFFKLLADTAHIWEEIVFRLIPVSLSILAMSVPIISFVTIPLSLLFFLICQNQFIKAHNITEWITENNLDWSTWKILKATILNIFPSKESKEKFEQFKKQQFVKGQTRQRILPTILLSIPYIYSMLFAPTIPVILLSTVIGIIFHKFFNSISKEKLNVFKNNKNTDMETLNLFLSNKNFIDLSNEQERQTLISILNKYSLSEKEITEIVSRINIDDINQYDYLLDIFSNRTNRLNNNVDNLIITLSSKIDVYNFNHIILIENILNTVFMKKDQIIFNLIDKLDFNNDMHYNFIKQFLLNRNNKNFQTFELHNKIVSKIDFNNIPQIELIKLFYFITDETYKQIISSFNFSNKQSLLLLSELIINHKNTIDETLIEQLLNKLDFNNEIDFNVFFDIIKNTNVGIDNTIEQILSLLNLNKQKHIDLINIIINKKHSNILSCFNSLIKYIDINNNKHIEILNTLTDNLISILFSHRIQPLQIYENTINKLPVNNTTNYYIFQFVISKLIEKLENELFELQKKYLNMQDGKATIQMANPTTFNEIKALCNHINEAKNLLAYETVKKLDSLNNNIIFFMNMYSQNVSIEEFCKRYGFKCLKQQPNIYFDSNRYKFTKLLSLFPKNIINRQVNNLEPVFFIEKDGLDTQNLKNILNKFDAYMKLLDENLYILNKFNNLTDFSSQFDDVVEHIKLMIECSKEINSYTGMQFESIFKKILNEIYSGKTTIQQQKKLTEMLSNPFANIDSINTLINRIHQKANFDFLSSITHLAGQSTDKVQNIFVSKGKHSITAYNFSEQQIHPDIKKLLLLLLENPDFSTNERSQIFIKDNILMWNGLLGAHAARLIIDFNEDSRSIIADFHEGVIEEGSFVRIKALSSILENFGFNVDSDAKEYQKYDKLVGLVATIDKNTNLTEQNTNIYELAAKAMILFNNASALNKNGKFSQSTKRNIKIASLGIMDIYSRFFYAELFEGNNVKTTFNNRATFNKMLSYLKLPLIPISEKIYLTFLKKGKFVTGIISTLGQNTIDKYINKPIEKAFAQGYLTINDNGKLEYNNKYNPIFYITKKMSECLNQEDNKHIQEIDMLNQGAILSQISQRDLNLTTVGQIGEYVLKSGYMKLVDGRLNNIKGEFISFNILVDKNGIIRYSTCDLVGFPENMNNNSGRQTLTYEQLQQLFESEGYDINTIEPLTNQELYTYRNRLQQNIVNTGTPITHGLIISKPKNLQTRGIFGIVDSDIYIDEYANPENVGTAAKNKISLFTGGSYSSHAGIVLREYNKTAMIVNNSQTIKYGMKIKFYRPKGTVKTTNGFQTQEIEETEITLQTNDIVVIDFENNKLLLFQNKMFKDSKGNNILFELQKYIDSNDVEKIKDFIKKYQNNSELLDKIIEYIYYQSSDNSWLEDFLNNKTNLYQQPQIKNISRTITKKILNITNYIKHTSKNNVYCFGEKESLDATKVGTKSANQSKLFLLLEQLKKETGINNVAVPNGIVTEYDILEQLLKKEYAELYQSLESVIKNDFFDNEEKFIYVQDIVEQIKDLILNIPEEEIIKYIGKENLETFKNKLTIIRSSGVGEDSKEHSAAGIAESFGQVEYENIPKAIKETLLSFFSSKAIDYMIQSKNVIKPAVLIEEWIQADKSGIMMSEDNDGNRIIQVINGQGEDIVSGRITPYSFTIDIKTGQKIDGDYTNKKTLTKENLEKLTKIMEWLEQVEGYPVDIEFLIKDNIIYIVQVRPITTINNQETAVPTSPQKKQFSTPIVQDDQDIEETQNMLSTKAHIWEELLYRTIPSIIAMINPMIGIPLFLIMQPIFLVVHTIKHYTYDKTISFIDLLKQDIKNLSLATIALIIPYAISLSLPLLTPVATAISSKIISTAASTVTAQIIHYKYNKSVPIEKQLKTHKSQQQVSGASLRHPLTSQRDIIARMSELEQNMESMDIDVSKQSLLDLIKGNPLLISMVLETYCRAYHKNESKYTLGELLKYIKGNSHSTKQKDKLITDFRGYFGEVYVKYNAVVDIDENGNIIRLQMPLDENQAGYDLVDPKTELKIQVKTGEESIVKDHFKKYKKYHIPVFTVSEVKQLMINNNNPNKDLVFSFNLTKDDVLAFVTEVLDVLIILSKDKSLPADIKDLTFQEIIDICNGTTTENILSKQQIIDKIEQVQLSKKEDETEDEWNKLSIFENFKETGKLIFEILNFTTPIWEEILFRTIPTITAVAIISLPFAPFVTIPLAAIIFTLFQRQFVQAHIITDWLKTKDSGWLEQLSSVNIFKIAIFGIFPSKELKLEYKKYSKTYQAKKHLMNLIAPTIFLSSIYILTSLLPFTNTILLATTIAIVIHSFNNKNVELLETLRPINRNLKLQQTKIDNNFISFAENNGADFISIYDLPSKVRLLKKHTTPEIIPSRKYINSLHYKNWQYQQQFVANSVGFSLGLTTISISDNNKNKANLIQPISETNNLISWERGYDYFYGNTYIDERVVTVDEYVKTIIASCIRYNKHIFFFLPNNFMDLDSKTKKEFDYIQKFIQNNPQFAGYFTFVVGAYDFVRVNNNYVFQKYFNENEITKTIKKLLSFPQMFMLNSFISKIFRYRTSLSILDNNLSKEKSDFKLKQKILKLINIIENLKNKTSKPKYIGVNYKHIKSTAIEQLLQIDLQEKEQNITDVYIVEDIEQWNNNKYGRLINTGIKVKDKFIYKRKIGNMLFYYAKDVPTIEIAKAINETKQLNREIKSILSIKNKIEIDGIIIIKNGNGIGINDGLLEIGEMNLYDKTQQEIKEFMLSALEVKNTISIMYSQKIIIDLKTLSGLKLLKAIENGRARKVITEEQYNKLQLNKEKISELKENGIEIYVASNKIKDDYKLLGISGQIIRENGKTYIYDYYSTDKTELDEIKNQNELANLEEQLLNNDKLIMVDIKLLKKKFQVSNPIEAFSKLGALTGKIKITMGLENIKIKDIESVGYNINFDNIPEINQTDIENLIKTNNKEQIINIIGKDNEFAIILRNLKEEHVNRFKELIIERMLTKNLLTETVTAIDGIELQDKKLEILLGKLLLRQLNYSDKEKIKEEIISKRQLIKTLEKLKELDLKQKDNNDDSQEQQVLVNTIIKLILYDGQRVKGQQLQKQTTIDISKYRAMLSAA